MQQRPILILLAIMLLNILLHVPMFGREPTGQHVWRQVVGYAAARGYFEEDNRFFYPRTAIRLTPDDQGFAYHELPLTYWLVGESYHLTGEKPFNARVIPLLFNMLLIGGMYALGGALGFSVLRRLGMAFFAAFAPYYFYYAPSFEPNILGLSFFVAGLALFISTLREEKWGWKYLCSILLLTVGTLAKPTFLFFGLVLAALSLGFWQQRKNPRVLIYGVLGAAVMLAANFLVLRHGGEIHAGAAYERRIHTPFGLAEQPQSLSDLWINIWPALSKWFVEMYINAAALPFFICGAVLIWRSPRRGFWYRAFWYPWVISLLIFCSLYLMRLKDHDYYIAAALLLSAAVSAKGAEYFWQRFPPSRRWVIYLFLVGTLVVATMRGYNRWYKNPQVPSLLLESPEKITAHLPPHELILVEGDRTPNVFLYYLHRNGLSVTTMWGGLDTIPRQHFHWLVRYQPNRRADQDVEKFFDMQLVEQIEDFAIYAITAKSDPS